MAYLLGHWGCHLLWWQTPPSWTNLINQKRLWTHPADDVLAAHLPTSLPLRTQPRPNAPCETASPQPRVLPNRKLLKKDKLLIRVLHSRQSYRGGELKHPMGPAAIKVAEIQAIDPGMWRWKSVISTAWAHQDHINVLEARSLGLTLRWRARTAGNIGTRFIHLLDSLVTMSSAAKGRSSSTGLRGVILRNCAYVLTAGFRPIYVYVRTHKNPADAPSRRAARIPYRGTRRARAAPPTVDGMDRPRAPPAHRGQATGRSDAASSSRASAPWSHRTAIPQRSLAAARRFSGWPMRAKRIGEADHPGPPKILDSGVRALRKEARRGRRLADHRIELGTLTRYARGVRAFFQWVKLSEFTIPEDPYHFDQLLGDFIEECWEEGEGHQFVLDTKCGLCFRFKGLGVHLQYTGDLLRAWKKAEMPARAPPMPLEVLVGMAGLAQHWQLYDVTLVLLVAYHCYLRTGEFTSLMLHQFAFAQEGTCIITLPNTKGTKRSGAVETVSIEDPALVAAVRLYHGERHGQGPFFASFTAPIPHSV